MLAPEEASFTLRLVVQLGQLNLSLVLAGIVAVLVEPMLGQPDDHVGVEELVLVSRSSAVVGEGIADFREGVLGKGGSDPALQRPVLEVGGVESDRALHDGGRWAAAKE